MLIYALKNAQIYTGIESITQMLLSTIGFLDSWESGYSLNIWIKNPKKNNKSAVRLKGLKLKVANDKHD